MRREGPGKVLKIGLEGQGIVRNQERTLGDDGGRQCQSAHGTPTSAEVLLEGEPECLGALGSCFSS